jgi:hypothetical protein
MVTDDAPCGSAEGAMVTSKMAGNAAHERALDATFGVCGCGDCEK